MRRSSGMIPNAVVGQHIMDGVSLLQAWFGEVVIVMLGGGDKSTQSADIIKAIHLADTLED
ncbi:MAG: hypothetical protein ACXWT0_15035 [Methylobacter sp.]